MSGAQFVRRHMRDNGRGARLATVLLPLDQHPQRSFALVADLLRGARAWQLSHTQATERAAVLAEHLG